MTALDFTTKRHVSCKGCYFYSVDHIPICLKDSQQDLLDKLFQLFGKCFKKEIIYILKPKN